MKILILPDNLKDYETLELKIFNQQVNDEQLFYFIEKNTNKFYEIFKYGEDSRSWFLDNYVEKDGSLYMLTPVDKLYILLPHLMKINKQFRSLDDILIESDLNSKQVDCKYFNDLKLTLIADVKCVDDDEYIRFNEEKTLEWLSRKFELIEQVVIDQKITSGVSSIKVKGFDSGRKDTNDDKSLSVKNQVIELLLRYVPNQIINKLRQHLNINEAEENIEQSNKHKIDDEKEFEENGITSASIDATRVTRSKSSSSPIDTKKRKISRAEKGLMKVNTKGMKSISSYFNMKTK